MTKLRLTLDVEYDPNGVDVKELEGILKNVTMDSFNNGGFTQSTEAEVVTWNQSVEEIDLTEEEQKYIDSDFKECPNCQSDSIEACGSPEWAGREHTLWVKCNDCDATWDDVYIQVGMKGLELDS